MLSLVGLSSAPAQNWGLVLEPDTLVQNLPEVARVLKVMKSENMVCRNGICVLVQNKRTMTVWSQQRGAAKTIVSLFNVFDHEQNYTTTPSGGLSFSDLWTSDINQIEKDFRMMLQKFLQKQ